MPSPSETPPSAVGVVTVSYHSEGVLDAFLASVTPSTSRPTQVVVVDNAPEDSVRRMAEDAGARYLARHDNPGYGSAMNAGVARLDDSIEWVLITNPDVMLEPGAIDRLLAGIDDESIGSIGPAVLNPDGSVYPSARSIPSIRTGVGHALFANLWSTNPWSRAYRKDADVAARRDAGWLSGSCLLVRRAAFTSVGGFDDSYFMYFEDVDLGFRLGRAGWRNVYEPSARVVHTGAHSTASRSSAMIRAHHRSAELFIARKYPGARLAWIRIPLRIGLAVRSALISRWVAQHH